MNAELWRARARAAEPVFEKTLPSGFRVKLQRVPLESYLLSGKLPQALTSKLAATYQAESAGQKAEVSLTLEETMQALEFMRSIVRTAVVYPKIVEGGTGEHEIDPSEIPAEDFQAIFAWCMAGCPDIPVLLASGKETTVEAVSNFRDEQGRLPADAGADVLAV